MANIFYTIDGSEPTNKSTLYHHPFKLDKTASIKAVVFQDGSSGTYLPAVESATVSEKAIKYEWMRAINLSGVKPGIAYKYFEPSGKIDINALNQPPVNAGVTDVISVAKKQRVDKFVFDFSGYLKISKDAVYIFYTQSDDGSKLFIDDEEVVDNDGDHGTVEKSGKAPLKKGRKRPFY